MARREECARHQSCDCVKIEKVLDAAEEDEVLPEAWKIASDLRIGGFEIVEMGPLFRDYAPILHRLADDLEEIVAHLRGQRRYRVDLHYGTIFAEDEDEAVRKAWVADARLAEAEEDVEHRPMVRER